MSNPNSIQIHTYIPGQHQVRPIPFKAHKIEGFTPENLERHFEIKYGGAILRLNQIELSIAANNQVYDEALRLQQLLLLNSIMLHENYFDSIGEDGGVELDNVELIHALTASFGGVAQWQAEFRLLADSAGAGWVVLAWSERFKRLVNVRSVSDAQVLVGSIPLLVLDMAEHAYSHDFGSDRMSYYGAFINSVNWARVSDRFQLAVGATRIQEEPSDDYQISVADLKARIDHGEDIAVVDVRHGDDRDRYRYRIMKSDFQDSFDVASWANDLPKNRPVVVYCMYGFWVSQKAAEELREHGVDARSLSGGITSWRAMGYPWSKNEY